LGLTLVQHRQVLGNPEVVRKYPKGVSNRTPATKSEPESDRLWFFVNLKEQATYNRLIAGPTPAGPTERP